MPEIFLFKNILSSDDASGLITELNRIGWADGSVTAKGMARSVKKNEQISKDRAPKLIEKVAKAIASQQTLMHVTIAKAFTNIMFSRYVDGMTYGTHSDAAIMPGGLRADLSFTLFLSDPKTYEGGELSIELPLGERKIKLPSGCMVVYPTGVLHRVMPVTSGERICVVGWLQSRIRNPHKRQLIIDLDIARKAYLEKAGHDRNADLLLKAAQDLRRMWDD